MPDFLGNARIPFAPSGKRKTLTMVVGVIWLGAILAGTFLLFAYASSPGKVGLPPAHWPDASGISRDPHLPTLVMFMHPHCPCSNASVGELSLLMAHCQNRVKVTVLFLRPAEMTDGWVESETWKEAARIPGVMVRRDEAGREAGLFHIETSGDTVLYDTKGDLLFHGGITISRGHSGDNPGRDSLQALLFGESSSVSNTPAFGCSLFECSSDLKP
jgi:hypothetical protein